MSKHKLAPPRMSKLCVSSDSKHSLWVAENLLNRQFADRKPDEVWSKQYQLRTGVAPENRTTPSRFAVI